MIFGIISALIAATLIALGNVFLKKSFATFPPSVSFFLIAIISFLFWLPTGLLLDGGFRTDAVLFGIGIGITSAVFGQLLYIILLEKGTLSVTVPLLSSYSIYTILFSAILFGEHLSGMTLLYVSIAILGTTVVTIPERLHKKDLQQTKQLILIITGAILIATADTLTNVYIDTFSIGQFLFYVSIVQLVVGYIFLKNTKQSLSQFTSIVKKYKEYTYALYGSFAISTGTLFLFLGFHFTFASIVAPLVSINPVLTVLLAFFYLHEKIKPKSLIGIILVLLALIGLGFSV